MQTHYGSSIVSSAVDRVAHEARVIHRISEPIITIASDATLRAFGGMRDSTISHHDEDRVNAYFWAVVRRRAVRAGEVGLRRVRQRAVAVSIIDDLRQSGRDTASIVSELDRLLGGVVDDDVVEECRYRLCG